MLNRKIIYSLLLAVLVIALIFGLVISYSSKNDILKVVFLDVGQGDAILISQGSNQMLIDGGRSGKIILEKLGEHIPFWDRHIEAVVATHPDQDHIGGLVGVLNSYGVGLILETGAISQTKTYEAWKKAVLNEKAEQVEALKGINIKFSDDAGVEIIYPLVSLKGLSSKNNNENSVVMKLNFGENSFLFTGDLPSKQEDSLQAGEVDFLKVSHHGSKYSTSEYFLGKINSTEAIISAGRNNRYGHPNDEVIKRLKKKGIKIMRTDEDGDIVYECEAQGEKCRVRSE